MVIQNIECEPLGLFAEAGADFIYVRPYAGEAVPDSLEGWDALIVLGGPMAVYEADKTSFLATELELLKSAIACDFPVLGICLGSQLIAAAAGGRVFSGPAREVGWGEVELTEAATSDALFSGLPGTLPVFQLHGDTFDLPDEAVRLAGNEVYPNQAFRIGKRVYGFQFHVEVNSELICDWVEIYRDYIYETEGDVEAILEALPERIEVLRPVASGIIERFLELCH
jgi:GMP synthase-like glutamine amidotransferase